MLKHTFYFTIFVLIFQLLIEAKFTPIMAQELDDCSEIIFWSEHEEGRGYYVMDSDGRNLTRLTDHSASGSSPIWRPCVEAG